jgi:hypothetical protein
MEDLLFQINFLDRKILAILIINNPLLENNNPIKLKNLNYIIIKNLLLQVDYRRLILIIILILTVDLSHIPLNQKNLLMEEVLLRPIRYPHSFLYH